MTTQRRIANPLGPTGETVRANIERLRTSQRMTYVELSEKLDTLGRRIPTLGLRHIEQGKRKVDVDELMGLAVALGVSPLSLLMPNTSDGADVVEVTSAGPIPARIAWRWAEAQAPLSLAEGPKAISEFVLFQDAARPEWLRLHPTIEAARQARLEKSGGIGYPQLGEDGTVTIPQPEGCDDLTIRPDTPLDDGQGE